MRPLAKTLHNTLSTHLESRNGLEKGEEPIFNEIARGEGYRGQHRTPLNMESQ